MRFPCIGPPPDLAGPGHTLDGLPILTEGDDEHGLWLFEAYRAVVLWARTPERARGRLFRGSTPDTAPDPVRRLRELLRASPPASGSEVGEACRAIVDACGDRPHAALHFVYARALADERSPSAARALAEAAARAGQLTAAADGYGRALAIARRVRSADEHVAALVGLAWVAEARADNGRAEAYLRRALRVMRRTGQYGARGAVLHALFRVRLARGDAAGAERVIQRAGAALRSGTAGAPAFLIDVARFHLSQLRHAAAAQSLAAADRASARLGEPPHPVQRALAAEAWAGLGNADAYRKAWNDAFDLGHDVPEVRAILGRAAERMLDAARVATLRRAGPPRAAPRAPSAAGEALSFPTWKPGASGEEAA